MAILLVTSDKRYSPLLLRRAIKRDLKSLHATGAIQYMRSNERRVAIPIFFMWKVILFHNNTRKPETDNAAARPQAFPIIPIQDVASINISDRKLVRYDAVSVNYFSR